MRASFYVGPWYGSILVTISRILRTRPEPSQVSQRCPVEWSMPWPLQPRHNSIISTLVGTCFMPLLDVWLVWRIVSMHLQSQVSLPEVHIDDNDLLCFFCMICVARTYHWGSDALVYFLPFAIRHVSAYCYPFIMLALDLHLDKLLALGGTICVADDTHAFNEGLVLTIVRHAL